MEIPAGLQARGLLEDRPHHPVGCPRVGGRFKDHESPRPQVGGDRPRGRFDVCQIGGAVGGQRRRNADQNRVGIPQLAVVSRGPKTAQPDDARHGLRWHMPDVGDRLRERLDFGGVRVYPQHRQAAFRECQAQGQADVAKADDRNISHQIPVGTRAVGKGYGCMPNDRRTRLYTLQLGRFQSGENSLAQAARDAAARSHRLPQQAATGYAAHELISYPSPSAGECPAPPCGSPISPRCMPEPTPVSFARCAGR